RLMDVAAASRRAADAARGAGGRGGGGTLVVSHDAYGWLCKRYGFTALPITGLSAGEPTPRSLERAIAAVKAAKAPAVFVEPQLSPASAKAVAKATGAKVLTLDPLGNGDWFAMMEANLAAIREGLGVREPAPAVQEK
ncbi:MAG: zinc ABC transporter substrate-binding protein, partial [Phycisphaerales bacterium]|nr:zinc ABC transporter substrate-binding protein [Phycisphaerales bacterium]